MNFFVKAAVVAAALGASAVASADTFDFSYVFADGQQAVTGSFAGLTSDGGQSATGISNLQVSFNGVAFSGGAGPLVLNAWDTGTGAFDAPSSSTTIFANASKNNFGISDVDQSANSSPDYFFNFINDPTHPMVGSTATALNALQTDAFSSALGFQFDSDNATGTWTMHDVSAVPLPPGLPLLLSGCVGLFGIARRRRVA
jgi:hypothetical protein